MGMPLIDRNPTSSEQEVLQLFLSFFSNGMGWENEPNGKTRVGWRQIERVLSYFYTGEMHKEDKDVFDLIISDWNDSKVNIGISVKSKELKQKSQIFGDEPTDLRLHMELSNSNAKFWDSLVNENLSENSWGDESIAQLMGDTVIELVRTWHLDRFKQDSSLSSERSRYMVVSYSSPNKKTGIRDCQIHSFDLNLPKVKWTFSSPRCLRGNCTKTSAHLFDWYGKSGGQLKYYPNEGSALFKTEIFPLLQVNTTPFIDLVEQQFPFKKSKIVELSDFQRKLFNRNNI